MEKLFLLNPNFQDDTRGAGKSYFCPPCALIEGVLSLYPELRKKLEIHHVDFVRPRPSIIELIGENNQSCPVLIKTDGTFINDPDLILDYLAKKYGIGYAH
ncbi:MAG: DUF3088 family protein [Prolixibacteraceae bacterium]